MKQAKEKNLLIKIINKKAKLIKNKKKYIVKSFVFNLKIYFIFIRLILFKIFIKFDKV